MAILQALIAALARSAGRLLNTAFGWATVMIFGKVPADRQGYLSVLAFGSVLWMLGVAGIAFPRVGTFLLAVVPLPDWISPGWVRLGMLALAIILPPILGALSLLLKDAEERPRAAAAKARAVLRGYPFTLGLALTLILMTLFAPILKLRALARRWASQHVPMLVEPEDYEAVVGEVQEQLRQAGWETRREPASWMVRAPTKVLTTLAGGAGGNLVAERLTSLRAEHLEVMLHPSDLVIQGREADVARVRAALAERLALSRAHLTWTKDGNELEDRIRGVWREIDTGREAAGLALGRLRALEEELRRAEIPYEEWEVLFRAKLLVEVAVYRGAGVSEREGWLRRTVMPLGVGLIRHTLESPTVRQRLDEAIVRLLGKLTRDGRIPEEQRARYAGGSWTRRR